MARCDDLVLRPLDSLEHPSWAGSLLGSASEVHVNPLVWGRGNVHLLGDRGTVRIRLDDVRRFDSGVVLLTIVPPRDGGQRACVRPDQPGGAKPLRS